MGHYKIIKEIGRGGTSTSYIAVKPPLEREILLKVLYPQLAKDKEIISRFEREATLLSKLNHPNIVQILDFGEIDDTYFIAMELIEGEPLSSLLEKKKFSEQESISIIMKLLDALSYVHKKGIIHRDINPSNIIITKDGIPKLTDFGLAWSKGSINITQEGTFLGTPSYMSLEQLKGEKIDQSTDIYSTGLIFIELITGVKCFTGTNYAEIIQNILTKEPNGIKEIEFMCPPALVKIIKKMIEKDREKRYKSADEVISDIKKYLGETTSKKKNLSTVVGVIIGIGLLVLVGLNIKKIYNTPIKQAPQEEQPSQVVDTIIDTVIINQTPKVEETKPLTKTQPIIQEEIPIYINIIPYGKVFFNNKFVGESPPLLEIKTKKGTHTIEIKNPKFPDIIKEIQIQETQQININLLKEVGYLSVIVKPWAEVWINDKYYSTTPIAEPIILLPGTYELKLRNPYYNDYVDTISLSAGDTLNIKWTFEK